MPPEAGKGKDVDSSQKLPEETGLLTPLLQTSDLKPVGSEGLMLELTVFVS